MGRVFSPTFDNAGALTGLTHEVRDTRRPEDKQTLKRLAQIEDPSGSAAVFAAKLEERELSIKPTQKPDLGIKS
jgi:hypothetical protein